MAWVDLKKGVLSEFVEAARAGRRGHRVPAVELLSRALEGRRERNREWWRRMSRDPAFRAAQALRRSGPARRARTRGKQVVARDGFVIVPHPVEEVGLCPRCRAPMVLRAGMRFPVHERGYCLRKRTW